MNHESMPRQGLLRELDQDECWEHLTAHHFGRIAYVLDGSPTILPFNYLALEGRIWLRTASYSELAIHLPGQRVAFSVDHADEHTRTGWSVLLRGRAEHATGGSPQIPGDSFDPTPWPDGTRSMVLCLTPSEVTGRVLRQPDVSPAAGHGPRSVRRPSTGATVTSHR